MRPPSAVLIVRLGALGDIVHGLPVAAALRSAFPDARIDWLVDARHRHLLDLVPILTTRVAIDTRAMSGPTGVARAIRTLRAARYDVALDLQGLIKSAALARLSGASRVVGFSRDHLREGAARLFYNERVDPGMAWHVVDRGLALLRGLDVEPSSPSFPLAVPASAVPARAREALALSGHAAFVALNPSAAWPNKRWPVDRFGALAAALRARTTLRSIVLWGPGEEDLAKAVSEHSDGAAVPAAPTSLDDLIALVASARLVIAGDTGPLHLAAAVGTPVVGLYGPTDPARNGPWSTDDITVSRSSYCQCSHQRRCRIDRWCLLDISVDEVVDAAVRRLAIAPPAGTRTEAAFPAPSSGSTR